MSDVTLYESYDVFVVRSFEMWRGLCVAEKRITWRIRRTTQNAGTRFLSKSNTGVSLKQKLLFFHLPIPLLLERIVQVANKTLPESSSLPKSPQSLGLCRPC